LFNAKQIAWCIGNQDERSEIDCVTISVKLNRIARVTINVVPCSQGVLICLNFRRAATRD